MTTAKPKPGRSMKRRPMKLVMLSHYFEEHRGGVEIVAGALARALNALDFEVAWLATGVSSGADENSRPRRRVLAASNLAERLVELPYPAPFPSAWSAIFEEIRDADAVLVHDSLYLTSVAACLAARLYRKPLVVVQHIGLVPYRSLILRQLMAIANRIVAVSLLERADQVVFISELTRRYFDKLRYVRAPALVFNGVDTAVFSPPANDSQVEDARRSFDLPLGVPVALFVGRFVEKKGLLFLERLARERPDVIFAFAGWGAIDPSSWSLPNVRVFGSLSGASLARLYRAGDLLLLPSVGEGFPLVIQEALASGLPVICGLDTAGADTAAEPFLKAVVIDAGDPERTVRALSEAMARLREAPDGARERAARFEFARARYSWRACAERYAELLQDLASNASSIPRGADRTSIS